MLFAIVGEEIGLLLATLLLELPSVRRDEAEILQIGVSNDVAGRGFLYC